MSDDKSEERLDLERRADLLDVDYPWNLGDDKLAERVAAAEADAGPQTPPADAGTADPEGVPTDGIVVTGPRQGRWRAGRHFTKEPRIIPLKNLTEDEVAAIRGDPALSVEDWRTEATD